MGCYRGVLLLSNSFITTLYLILFFAVRQHSVLCRHGGAGGVALIIHYPIIVGLTLQPFVGRLKKFY